MNPITEQGSGDFTRTRWSMVRELQNARAADARAALTELAVRYWYPVYAYVRRCGHAQEIAQDITQAFLQQVAADLREGFSPPTRFRHWLLVRLNSFLGGEWRELAEGGNVLDAPALAELESRNRSEHSAGASPEQAYQRSFALEVISRTLKRLRAEARQTGHLDMCESLEPFLARDPLPGQYEELGRKLGVRPLTLVMALKRLRQRFRELVREELADTVSSPEELAAEQRALFAALDREPRA
ncbi:MAG: RNA polymerase sigma factor [Rhodanobacteraceae bacterium]